MEKAEAEKIFSSVVKMYNSGDLSHYSDFFSKDLEAYINNKKLNYEENKRRNEKTLSKFKNFSRETRDLIYENNRLAVRFDMTAYSKEDEKIEESIIIICYFENKKIKRIRMISNFFAILN